MLNILWFLINYWKCYVNVIHTTEYLIKCYLSEFLIYMYVTIKLHQNIMLLTYSLMCSLSSKGPFLWMKSYMLTSRTRTFKQVSIKLWCCVMHSKSQDSWIWSMAVISTQHTHSARVFITSQEPYSHLIERNCPHDLFFIPYICVRWSKHLYTIFPTSFQQSRHFITRE